MHSGTCIYIYIYIRSLSGINKATTHLSVCLWSHVDVASWAQEHFTKPMPLNTHCFAHGDTHTATVTSSHAADAFIQSNLVLVQSRVWALLERGSSLRRKNKALHACVMLCSLWTGDMQREECVSPALSCTGRRCSSPGPTRASGKRRPWTWQHEVTSHISAFQSGFIFHINIYAQI